ncbi:hypothetical protein BAE44_0014908, partial [Dichanthelium oligosanthes]
MMAASHLVSAAQWIAVVITEKVVTSKLQEWVSQFSGLGCDIDSLKGQMIFVETVLSMAQERRIRNAHLTSLLARLHQLLYDADDALDEIDYHRVHQDAQRGDQITSVRTASTAAATAVLHLLSDVVSHQPLASPTFRDMFMYPWPWGRRKRRKLAHLTADANASGQPWLELDWGALGRRIREATAQLRDVNEQPAGEHKMFGRNGQKDSIIEVLTDIRCSSQSRLPVLPVVGNGGIGKTTLPQHVYHDQRVRSFFHIRMWICVSHCPNFSVLRLTHGMLEAATELISTTPPINLSAKSVGALLRKDLSIEHWNRILESRAWEEQNGIDCIMSILRLSYEYLPFHLQRFDRKPEEVVNVSSKYCLTIDRISMFNMHPSATIRHMSIITESVYHEDISSNVSRNENMEKMAFREATNMRSIIICMMPYHEGSLLVANCFIRGSDIT